MPERVELEIGCVFADDYRIERPLGRGGMGSVWVAHQISTGRERALKIMHARFGDDESMRRRFVQEARVGSRIKSEHVVEVIAAGVDAKSGIPWIAMELLEGEDLDTHVKRVGPLSLAGASSVLTELCHALGAAHAVGVVHRDLKPENVFLANSHREGAPTCVKLLDLGIAKLVAESQLSETAAVGTPLWMAPEQTAGRAGSPTDVWALGLLAFWMLTGKSYWLAANTPGEVPLMGVLREVVVDPLEKASVRAEQLDCKGLIPAGFDAWFSRCVERDPAKRFADARVARAELGRMMLGSAETIELSAPLAPSANTSAPNRAEAHSGDVAPTAQTRTFEPMRSRRSIAYACLLALVPIAAIGAWRFAQRPVISGSAAAQSSSAGASQSSADAGDDSETPVDQNDSTTVWRIPIGDSPMRGERNAPITIVEFGNFQCPSSKALETKVRAILDEYREEVRLVWKDDPLAIHWQAEAAAQVARVARAQKGDAGFWEAHDRMIDPDFKTTRESLLEAGKQLGLSDTSVVDAIDHRTFKKQITEDADLADEFAVIGTPVFFVNGRRVLPAPDLSNLKTVIDDEVRKREKQASPPSSVNDLYAQLTKSGRGGLKMETRKFHFRAYQTPGRGRGGVLLVEFCDYTSYLCRLVQPTLDELLRDQTDVISLYWNDVPNPSNENSRTATLLGLRTFGRSGEDRWAEYRDLLFAAQKQPTGVTKPDVEKAAKKTGTTPQDFRQTLDDLPLLDAVRYASELGRQVRIEEPGAFIICSSPSCSHPGYFLSGAQPTRAFEKRIRLAIAANGGPLPERAH